MKDFRLPDPGEGLVEAEIVTWRVAVGDQIKVNDIVVEVETAKSLVELPSPYAGRVVTLLAAEGETVDVGKPIITIDDGSQPAEAPESPPEQEKRVPNLVGYGPRTTEAKRRPRTGTGSAPGNEGVINAFATDRPVSREADTREPLRAQSVVPGVGGPLPAPGAGPEEPVLSDDLASAPRTAHALAKPPVRKYAKDHGVDLAEVTATRADGVISRDDVDAFLTAALGTGEDAAVVGDVSPPGKAPSTRIPIKGVRKAMAAAMVQSAFTAPHVTEWVTLDVTATVDLVERLRKRREFRDVKLTPLLVIMKIVCVALRQTQALNSSWDEAAQEIVQHHTVNLGIAAATPRGLVVPNIKAAELKSLVELGSAFTELVAAARAGKTPPADMTGGTFTITNVGTFGIDAGTPILNPGEAGILAVGAINRRPWVIGSGADEQIVPRWVTTLAVSFDHRLADGEQGSRFLADVAGMLADPGLALLF
ncbi:MAG: dihydrolipoamide acetyltransferase family protein [Propionibacteriaceae bacterium]